MEKPCFLTDTDESVWGYPCLSKKLGSWRMNSSDEKSTSQFPMAPQVSCAVPKGMTGTPYVILCLVQENGQKKVSHEHCSHNWPPAGALATECNHQVCSPRHWECANQCANNNAADVVMPMRLPPAHPATPLTSCHQQAHFSRAPCTRVAFDWCHLADQNHNKWSLPLLELLCH